MSDEINKQDDLDDEEVFDVIVLNDDEGNENEFMHLATLEVEGSTYFVLLPVEETEEDEEEAEAIILKLGKDENGEDMLMDIEDDEEWEKVADAWEEMEDEFDEE
ncbi:MAG: DUF1292 domain-containing protein [Dehalobacter sp. 4CP]|jgi:uncharacterized protein YrzB (UPF0473 family)|uniref:UPF0473 protein GQ588_06690 n=2 Tax=Dehalobacter restrictus TaxID=55583 RepID=A0A857DI10_9FIRM|nr:MULTISPECIES: DUF1292 domain-containing protein [Dehalobacter]NBJ14955.1 DUF1292 domain-containing protein [Dehalobacter sp. 4CP]AFV01436.1 hypothetical protein DHBDCA_p408 [Dehalobacter sp. DCA]AFV04473.1 hypothetical protein DCF50_p467 [Dehalobacter sp. CF]AHF09751.1 hypothetical protein DEHRE_06420 [Dehalobacter restrictus DSM 9455]EQB20543.1 hypothetical protein UNSWDHB_2092 [Dehalobacter sp. UNSWDHB]